MFWRDVCVCGVQWMCFGYACDRFHVEGSNGSPAILFMGTASVTIFHQYNCSCARHCVSISWKRKAQRAAAATGTSSQFDFFTLLTTFRFTASNDSYARKHIRLFDCIQMKTKRMYIVHSERHHTDRRRKRVLRARLQQAKMNFKLK